MVSQGATVLVEQLDERDVIPYSFHWLPPVLRFRAWGRVRRRSAKKIFLERGNTHHIVQMRRYKRTTSAWDHDDSSSRGIDGPERPVRRAA